MTGRLVIDNIRPRTPSGVHPAKAVVGERVPVRAVIFKEGHDILAARALLTAAGRRKPDVAVDLVPVGNDVWEGSIVPRRLGRHELVIEAWTDRWATWAHKAEVKLEAGQEVEVEIAEGIQLLELVPGAAAADGKAAASRTTAGPSKAATSKRAAPEEAAPAALAAARRASTTAARAAGRAQTGARTARVTRPAPITAALAALGDEKLEPAARLAPALGPGVQAILAGPATAVDLTSSEPQALWVDRERALVGAWYELFPRSYGGFRGVLNRLPEIAAMGFDIVYFPPIHPIGVSHRKGRNNTLVAGPDDPGSPWAIGSAEGGHTSIHPDLGTMEDFAQVVDRANELGMEIALDYALQCSPDHPWVHEHPEWFNHRPDGSIAYAENPPKKYQDIYPINFWPANEKDRVALWQACKGILDFWIARGVRVFRVDNPHTKPNAFWEWVIPAVQAKHPGVVFLAEAFTRPYVMAKLAEIGFTQSYTYFTWRTVQHGDEGLWAYMEEVALGPKADYMRPNFWPSTPDILSGPLRRGPASAFALRAVLAATLSPSYGIYSGYELYENQPASETNEEYLNSEKYQIVERDFSQPGSLVPLLTALNRIRREHPAFQRLRNIVLHPSDNPSVFAYSKVSEDGTDAVLTVVNLDPYNSQDSTIHLQLRQLDLPDDRPYRVHDLLSGDVYQWFGSAPFVRLEPWIRVAHVLDLRWDRATRDEPVDGALAGGALW